MRAQFVILSSLLLCCALASGCGPAPFETALELRAGQTATLSTTRSETQTFRPLWGEVPCPPPELMTEEPQTWPWDLPSLWQALYPELEAEWEESVQGLEDSMEQTCWSLCDEAQMDFTGDLLISPHIEPLEVPYDEEDCEEEEEPIEIDLELLIGLGTTVECTCEI